MKHIVVQSIIPYDKKNKFLLHATTCLNIANVMLEERSQRQKNLYCPAVFICKVQRQAKRTDEVRNQDGSYLRGGGKWAAIGRDLSEDPGSVSLAFLLLDLITPRSLFHDNSWEQYTHK